MRNTKESVSIDRDRLKEIIDELVSARLEAGEWMREWSEPMLQMRWVEKCLKDEMEFDNPIMGPADEWMDQEAMRLEEASWEENDEE